MPTINKQSNKPRTAPVNHDAPAVDRIAPIKSTNVGRLKFALYGVPKTGKTRFACSFPKPLLLIGAEDGTASVVGTPGVDFVQLRSSSEFSEIVAGPLAEGRYKSVVLDTASKMRDMRTNELFEAMGMDTPPEKKPFLYADAAWKAVWTQCAKDMKDLLRQVLDLPRVMDLNVVVISQEQNLNELTQSDSDLVRPVIGSALGRSVCEWLHAECDYIGQMLIREQVVVNDVPVEVSGKKSTQQVKQRTGRKEYCMRVATDGVYQAGFRLPAGRALTEEFITNPSYDKVLKLLQGTK